MWNGSQNQRKSRSKSLEEMCTKVVLRIQIAGMNYSIIRELLWSKPELIIYYP